MFHLVAHAVPRTLAFRTWIEARGLWDCVVAAVPGLEMLVLMPDHVHLMHEQDVRLTLAAALSGYTRWRNHRRNESGAAFVPLPQAEVLTDRDKVRRHVRYVALNPCRARLVADPLAWPLSTYRDLLGLAIRPVRRASGDPEGLHAYVSADPSARVDGTPLPRAGGGVTVHRTAARTDDDVRRIERVIHDPRFWGLVDGDLGQLPGWTRRPR